MLVVAVVALSCACESSTHRERSAFAPAPYSGIALLELDAEVFAPMDVHPTDGSLLVAEKSGRVVELEPTGDGDYRPVGTVINLGGSTSTDGAEQGLLGLTTDRRDQFLYLNYTRAPDGATVVSEFPLARNDGLLRAGEQRELLVLAQPSDAHNGGDLAWGPDDMLWVATGDGGPDEDPDGRAQRLSDPLGKILRLDPSLEGSGSALASSDNPYFDGGPESDAHPLVWARGLRNPWRISFDSLEGDLWVADVGQAEAEELSVMRRDDDLVPGANLGWDQFEGLNSFAAPGPTHDWPEDDAPLVEPLFSYGHNDGCAVVGGFVYRGVTLSELRGWYLLSDFCSSQLRAVDQEGQAIALGLAGAAVVSINPDENGEPLVLDSNGLQRLVPR